MMGRSRGGATNEQSPLWYDDIFDKTIANRAVAFHDLIVLQFSTVLNSWAEGDLYQRCTSAAHAPYAALP
jgi:hypothetical protein